MDYEENTRLFLMLEKLEEELRELKKENKELKNFKQFVQERDEFFITKFLERGKND